MKQAGLTLVIAGFVALLMADVGGPAFGQTPLKTKPQLDQTAPQVAPQRTLPRRLTPLKIGAPGVRLGNPGPVLKTHCNGTCACTGDDCTQGWKDSNCEGAATCSGSAGDDKDTVCSCVKKVKGAPK